MYLLEFLEQSDFPLQHREDRERYTKAQPKQITVHHVLSSQAEPEEQNSILIDPCTALQDDTRKYPAYGVLSDEIHICLGKMERYLFAERLQHVFHQDLELPEKNHKSICLLGMKCNEEGRYIPDSVQVSPLAWGIHQLLSHADELTKENMADFLSTHAYKDSISE